MTRPPNDAIYSKVVAYLQNREIFVFDGFAGADKKYMQRFRIINELASQNLFIHQLLRRPTEEGPVDFKPDLHHYCGSRLQVHPRNRRNPQRGCHSGQL